MKILLSYEDKTAGPKTIAVYHGTELRSHTFKLIVLPTVLRSG